MVPQLHGQRVVVLALAVDRDAPQDQAPGDDADDQRGDPRADPQVGDPPGLVGHLVVGVAGQPAALHRGGAAARGRRRRRRAAPARSRAGRRRAAGCPGARGTYHSRPRRPVGCTRAGATWDLRPRPGQPSARPTRRDTRATRAPSHARLYRSDAPSGAVIALARSAPVPGRRAIDAVRGPVTTPRGVVVLDAGGQAPLLPAARAAFLEALDEGWADPRRLHAEGRRARLLLDGAREAIAAAVGARTEEVDLAPVAHRGAARSRPRRRARSAPGRDAGRRRRRRAGRRAARRGLRRGPRRGAARSPSASTARAGSTPSAVRRPPSPRRASRSPRCSTPTARSAPLQPVEAAHAAARAAGVPLLVDAGAEPRPRRRSAAPGTCSPPTRATGAVPARHRRARHRARACAARPTGPRTRTAGSPAG